MTDSQMAPARGRGCAEGERGEKSNKTQSRGATSEIAMSPREKSKNIGRGRGSTTPFPGTEEDRSGQG